jgi:hypothetical protein
MPGVVAEPGSLENLHDIVVPAAVPLLPPAPGWYAVGVLALVSFLFLGLRGWRRYRANRYRREALALLKEIEASGDRASVLGEVALLVKRVALAAYPRLQVASLSGEAWRAFLEEASGGVGVTPELQRLASDEMYASGASGQPSEEDLRGAFDAARSWILSHPLNRRAVE